MYCEGLVGKPRVSSQKNRVEFKFIIIAHVTSTEQQSAVCIHPEVLSKKNLVFYIE